MTRDEFIIKLIFKLFHFRFAVRWSQRGSNIKCVLDKRFKKNIVIVFIIKLFFFTEPNVTTGNNYVKCELDKNFNKIGDNNFYYYNFILFFFFDKRSLGNLKWPYSYTHLKTLNIFKKTLVRFFHKCFTVEYTFTESNVFTCIFIFKCIKKIIDPSIHCGMREICSKTKFKSFIITNRFKEKKYCKGK